MAIGRLKEKRSCSSGNHTDNLYKLGQYSIIGIRRVSMPEKYHEVLKVSGHSIAMT
jgi:hypothetical protein